MKGNGIGCRLRNIEPEAPDPVLTKPFEAEFMDGNHFTGRLMDDLQTEVRTDLHFSRAKNVHNIPTCKKINRSDLVIEW
ncbi:MAG: hypothetical protein K0S33_2477 [Bacteroidetes bacterium]|nr:hypothetical protein [Bacteroidota bacterium]